MCSLTIRSIDMTHVSIAPFLPISQLVLVRNWYLVVLSKSLEVSQSLAYAYVFLVSAQQWLFL